MRITVRSNPPTLDDSATYDIDMNYVTVVRGMSYRDVEALSAALEYILSCDGECEVTKVT